MANEAVKVLEIGYLESLANAILESNDPEEVEERLRYLLKFYGVVNFPFSYSRMLWRARNSSSADGYTNVRDLGSPPEHLVKPGRLNQARSPVLYLSLSQFSALTEIDAPPGSFVQIMSYAFQPNRKLVCGILGEISQVYRWGNALLSSELGANLNTILNKMEYRVAQSFVYTDSFLSAVMRNRSAGDNSYLHSRTLSNLLFEQYPSVDAIIYPGVKLEGAMNFAIRPSSAERILYPNGTAVIRIDKQYKYGIFDITPMRHTTSINYAGEFVWP